MSPECRLLKKLLAYLGCPTRGEPRRLAVKDVDWPRFISLVEKHRLSPLLFHELQDTSWQGCFPPEVRSAWEEAHALQKMRFVLVQDHLHRVLEVLHRNGVEPIILKGGHLAEQYYAEPVLRPCEDIDLLVRPRDRFVVRDLLEGAGYRLFESGPMEETPTHQKFVYFGPDGAPQLALEVDTGLQSPKRRNPAFDIGIDDPWHASGPAMIAGVPARTLQPSFNLIYLAFHLSQHAFSGLLWLYDLHLVVNKSGAELNWDDAVFRARQYRCATIVYYALFFTKRLFHSPVPAYVLEALAPGPFKKILIRTFITEGGILRGDPPRSERSAVLQRFLLNDSWARSLKNYLFLPASRRSVDHQVA